MRDVRSSSLRAIFVASAFALAALLATAKDESDITCNQSGMCSVGKTTHFYGSVVSSEGLKTALESVSYKKELILVTTYGAYYLEFLFQLRNQFRRLGMDHFLALSMKEEGCQEVAMVGRGVKNISCAWDDSLQHRNSWGGGPLLWHLRWRFLARAARVGYNVLSMDSDYMVHQDPYAFLKRPPFDDVQLLATKSGACNMNGGFVYIQNTTPDGPVAWMFRRTTEVPLRWMDDDYAHTNSWGKTHAGMCWTFDQSFLDDALHSTIAGQPIAMKVFSECASPDWVMDAPDGFGSGKWTKQMVCDKQNELVSCEAAMARRGAMSLPLPTTFPKLPTLGSEAVSMSGLPMRVPSDGPELGPQIFDKKGGKYSDVFFQQLKEDCEECPPFKGGAQNGDGTSNNTEKFMFVPRWLTTGASNLNHGYMTPVDGSRPRQVMTHFHYLPFTRDAWKSAVSKIYGGFDWKLSKFLHADKEANKKLAPGPYMAGIIPEKVLVLSPDIFITKTRDLREFKRITAGLLQLALISGRTIVFPDIPCETAWVHKDEKTGPEACSSGTQLLSLHQENMPYAARVEPTNKDNLEKSYRIFNAFLADAGCLKTNSAGMLNVEFEEWVRHDCPQHNANGPWKGNTVFHIDKSFAAGKHDAYVADVMVVVSEEDAAASLAKYDNELLVYLGHPVAVNMSGGDGDGSKHNNWKQKYRDTMQACRGLFYTPYLLDSLGAANESNYIFGRMATVESGVLMVGNQSLESHLGEAARKAAEVEQEVVKKASVWGYPSQQFDFENDTNLGPINGSSCEGSGMCSLGKTKYFHGEVRSSAGFKAAVEAVSYKREIILVSAFGAYFLEFVFQLHNQFRKLGMDHFIIMSMEENGCSDVKLISKATLDYKVSCGWDDSPMLQRAWGRVGNHLWHIRWRFLARSARVGYNILALDSDYLVLQDPYAFLKRPPFSQVHLLGVEEHVCGMNGGLAYMQNVRPDGPIAWIFHHTTERPLRWMDDNMAHLISLGKQRTPNAQMCMTFDQSFIDDSLHSTMVGVPITQMGVIMCTNPEWKAEGINGATQQQAINRQMELYRCHESLTKIPVLPPPGAWPQRPESPKTHQLLRVARLRVPNANGKLDPPPELGGPIMTRHGGQYTDAYFKQLREDCPDVDGKCPWWKDERAEDTAAAANTTELFGILPKWFSTSASWLNTGYLTPLDGSKPRQAMVHFHVMGFESNEWKASVGKTYGAFDWTLSRRLHVKPDISRRLAPGPYFMGKAPQKVILLHPSVDLTLTRDVYEYKRIVAGLMQLAVLSNRTLVFPDLPCLTEWAHKRPAFAKWCSLSSGKLLMPEVEALPYAARMEPWDPLSTKREIRFFYSFFADYGCLSTPPFMQTTGLMGAEFEEWVARDAPEGNHTPTDANTVFPKRTASNMLSFLRKDGFLVDSLSLLDASEAATELSKYDDQALMFVGTPTVIDMESSYQNGSEPNSWSKLCKAFINGCRGVHYIRRKDLWVKDPQVVQKFIQGPRAKIEAGQIVRT